MKRYRNSQKPFYSLRQGSATLARVPTVAREVVFHGTPKNLLLLWRVDNLKFGNSVFCDTYSGQVANQTWGNRNQ